MACTCFYVTEQLVCSPLYEGFCSPAETRRCPYEWREHLLDQLLKKAEAEADSKGKADTLDQEERARGQLTPDTRHRL
jgi:hypothetical protein